jgi:hypothetical protein
MSDVDRDWLATQLAGVRAPVPSSSEVDAMWALLEDRAPGFRRVKDGVESTEIVRPRRGLLHDESASFLRAVDAGIAVVDEAGYITMPTVMAKSPIGRYALFSRSGTAMSINLEYVIQVGTTAELILDHGWPAHRVGFERGEFDAVAFDETGRVVLAMEAKARATGPDSLEKLVRAWIGFGNDPDADLANNAGRKWRELTKLCTQGPVTVWLVADSARWSVRASLDQGRVVLEGT